MWEFLIIRVTLCVCSLHPFLFFQCVAGEMGFIKIWDAANEICLQNVLTMSEKSTTALACRDEYEPCISIGCSDGTVRSFDLRTPTTFGPSQTFHGHKGSIVKVQLETENEFEVSVSDSL